MKSKILTKALACQLVLTAGLSTAVSAQSYSLPGDAPSKAIGLPNDQADRNQVTVLQKYFSPADTSMYTCRSVLDGGPATIKVFMCLVLKGGVVSMPGDIVAVGMKQVPGKLEVLINCKSTYTPIKDFEPTTMPGWGDMGWMLSDEKPNDFIGIGSVSQDDRGSWTYAGRDRCTWTTKAPEQAASPVLGVDLLKARRY